MKRTTHRWNDKEEAELDLFKKTYGLETDSEAVKFAVSWCNTNIKNVTETFFPKGYDVLIQRKRKSFKNDLKVYHKR